MTTKIELLPDERRTEMTNNIKLLPLPEGNVAHLIAAQDAEIKALRADVRTCEE